MLYAILAYHEEAIVDGWSAKEDAALMTELMRVHEAHVAAGHLGPAARLGPTVEARTLRGPGLGAVVDGPFAETKEQLLGLYLVEGNSADAAMAVARDLKAVNPTAVYEVRPIRLYVPGASLASD